MLNTDKRREQYFNIFSFNALKSGSFFKGEFHLFYLLKSVYFSYLNVTSSVDWEELSEVLINYPDFVFSVVLVLVLYITN